MRSGNATSIWVANVCLQTLQLMRALDKDVVRIVKQDRAARVPNILAHSFSCTLLLILFRRPLAVPRDHGHRFVNEDSDQIVVDREEQRERKTQ